jgi:hypothetical protein
MSALQFTLHCSLVCINVNFHEPTGSSLPRTPVRLCPLAIVQNYVRHIDYIVKDQCFNAGAESRVTEKPARKKRIKIGERKKWIHLNIMISRQLVPAEYFKAGVSSAYSSMSFWSHKDICIAGVDFNFPSTP